MQQIANLILESGEAAVELALFILLPIMVIMMALMKLLEARGLLAMIGRGLSPLLRLVKIPGVGVFAILQMTLVSFAAPVATLSIMDRSGCSRREIGATLAMLLTLAQANAVFPLVVVGLDLRFVFAFALVGGAVASTLTFKLLSGSGDDDTPHPTLAPVTPSETKRQGTLSLLTGGGWDGVQLVLKAIPILLLAIFLVNVLEALKFIAAVEWLLSPVLGLMDLPGVSVLAVATKYLAGGTALTGVAINLVQEGAMTTQELNRIAGLIINPLDLVGVSVLISAGPRVAAVLRPALLGATVGVFVRSALHLAVF